MDLMRMITKKMIEEALQNFFDNHDENNVCPKSQSELRADSEARHRRIEDLKKQALTNENNFNCDGCA